MAKTKKPELKKIRATLEEVLEATQTHFDDRSSEGDIYDSDKVDGVYWSVGGMYQLSPAGRKMRKYVSMELFTQYG